MPVNPGTRLGAYEITAMLGVGGMGEVYRARDTKLNRDVAIKVLPNAFAADPERRGRFEREAQLLASLNHPHIAQIYGAPYDAAPDGRFLALVRSEAAPPPAFASCSGGTKS
jgi:serine/threonine protein kinase